MTIVLTCTLMPQQSQSLRYALPILDTPWPETGLLYAKISPKFCFPDPASLAMQMCLL